MPTYDYKCPHCAQTASAVQSIASYIERPHVPECAEHGKMARFISVAPGMSGIANALAGDRHYDGLKAPDGSDISSRTKHREYMKRNNLTMTDDFKGVWAKAEQERQAYRKGEFKDKELRETLAKEVATKLAN